MLLKRDDRVVRWVLVMLLAGIAGCASLPSLGRDDRQAEYHYQMGVSYLAENNVTGALVELTQAEKIAPERTDILYHLGLAYFRRGKYETAAEKFSRAILLKPDFSAARNELAVTFMELKRWDDAIAQLRLVLDDIFFPGQGAATINLGLAHFGKGEYQKALEIFRKYVVENPSDPRGHLNLGRVYLAMERLDPALSSFDRALSLAPDYAMAHYQRALVLLRQKRIDEAKGSFAEVIRILPDSEIAQLSREHLDLLK
jgi:tetratricopeptide (TPR) repeat protein